MDDAAASTAPAPASSTRSLPGRTVVRGRAVASVARKAASEVPGVVLVSRSGLRQRLTGLLPGSGGTGGGASADVSSGSTAIELRLAVRWPEPVGSVTSEARRHVGAKVEELTGYTVRGIDIVVDSLPAPAASHRRVR